MRKMYKIADIALIFILIGVFLFQDISYSSDLSAKSYLRPNILNSTAQGRERFEKMLTAQQAEPSQLAGILLQSKDIKIRARALSKLKNELGYQVYLVRPWAIGLSPYRKPFRQEVYDALEKLAKDLGFDNEKIWIFFEKKARKDSKDYMFRHMIDELGKNIQFYAEGKGILLVREITENNRSGIELIAIDAGRGIDINKAMKEGYTTFQEISKNDDDGFHGYGLPLMRDFATQAGKGVLIVESKGLKITYVEKRSRIVATEESSKVEKGVIVTLRHFRSGNSRHKSVKNAKALNQSI